MDASVDVAAAGEGALCLLASTVDAAGCSGWCTLATTVAVKSIRGADTVAVNWYQPSQFTSASQTARNVAVAM